MLSGPGRDVAARRKLPAAGSGGSWTPTSGDARKDSQMGKVLFIDYENVQGMDLGQIGKTDWRVLVFTGSSQSKIPIELVSSAQALGDRLTWMRIEGSGPNALDFHIAYYLGVQMTKNPADEYYILSKDKGFDPLVKHVNRNKVTCRRIASISEIVSTRKAREPEKDYAKVVANLEKIEDTRRPRNRKTLRQHVKSLVGEPHQESRVDRIVEQLFASKVVTQGSRGLTYRF
jgi:hypothetical protein